MRCTRVLFLLLPLALAAPPLNATVVNVIIDAAVIGSDGRLLWRWVGNLHPVVESVRKVASVGAS